jgi:hypothetical protein
MDENKSRRRWLSSGIRDLLWATVVVGLGLGWWMDRRDTRERLATVAWQLESVVFLVEAFGEKVTVTDQRVHVTNGRGREGAYRLRNDPGPYPMLDPGMLSPQPATLNHALPTSEPSTIGSGIRQLGPKQW